MPTDPKANILAELATESTLLDLAQREQHELIRHAAEAGASLRAIAEVTGLCHETVRGIVRGDS